MSKKWISFPRIEGTASRQAHTDLPEGTYERELAKGLAKTAALCVVARKMARLCWSLHKYGTVYDSARVGQLAAKKTEVEDRNGEVRETGTNTN